MRNQPPNPRPAHRRDPVARRAGFVPRVGLVVAIAATLHVVGCRQLNKVVGPKENSDLLEAELRTREQEILKLRAENQHLRQLTDIYQRQGIPELHGVIAGPAYPSSAVSPAGPHISGLSLSLGTGTGGRDDDGMPGDETLQVVIVPKDDVGTAVKVPARATVTAAEITAGGLKVPIGKWEVTPEQLKRLWRGGFLSSGYFVALQWDQPPSTDRVRVTVRLTTPDGATYEADKDVAVKPLPGVAPRVASPSAVVPQSGVITGPVPTTSPDPSGSLLPPPAFPPDSNVLPPPQMIDDYPAKLGPARPK